MLQYSSGDSRFYIRLQALYKEGAIKTPLVITYCNILLVQQ